MIPQHSPPFSSRPVSRRLPDADVKLLGRIAKGDAPAIGTFVDRWSASLYRLTDGLRMDIKGGDKVAEEVFRRVLFEAPRFAARPEKFLPWLLGTARDCAASVLVGKATPACGLSTGEAERTERAEPDRSEITECCSALLRQARIADVLQYLNSLTLYRFTAVYRFDGMSIQNVHLFDRESGVVNDRSVSPVSHTYCLWIQETLSVVEMSDSMSDPRALRHPKRDIVRSYCGGPIRAADGRLLGTLCHFDYESRTASQQVLATLEEVGPLLAIAVG